VRARRLKRLLENPDLYQGTAFSGADSVNKKSDGFSRSGPAHKTAAEAVFESRCNSGIAEAMP